VIAALRSQAGHAGVEPSSSWLIQWMLHTGTPAISGKSGTFVASTAPTTKQAHSPTACGPQDRRFGAEYSLFLSGFA
jgi:hypothetical protein